MVAARGLECPTYHTALAHIRKQTRENGIDDALVHRNENVAEAEKRGNGPGEQELDARLFCDRRGIGQQYAAQAGYPIICIPIGLDAYGMPVSLSLQHRAWNEHKLVRWASAIEDLLWNKENGWRPTPGFKNSSAKIIPVEKFDE